MAVLLALVTWAGQLILNIVGVLLGLFVVPLALLFPDDSAKEATYRTDGTYEWWLRRLPSWAKWWDNLIDGTLGDDDFRYAGRDIPFGWKNTSFLGQWFWMAIRNPFNYFKRFILGCDVRQSTIKRLWGDAKVRDDFDTQGAQFLRCGRFFTFYWVRRWGNTNRGIVVQLGNKFDLEDAVKTYPPEQSYKYFKGFTFEVNPIKDIS